MLVLHRLVTVLQGCAGLHQEPQPWDLLFIKLKLQLRNFPLGLLQPLAQLLAQLPLGVLLLL